MKKWEISQRADDDSTVTYLTDPDGKVVFEAKINRCEEDANGFWVDRDALLKALNAPAPPTVMD